MRTFEQKEIERLRRKNPFMSKEEIGRMVLESVMYKHVLTGAEVKEKENYISDLLFHFENPSAADVEDWSS